MTSKLSITDSTTISVSLLVMLMSGIVAGTFYIADMKAKNDQNTRDIATIFKNLDTLNANLVETNGNIIRLNTRLDGLTDQRSSITVAPTTQPEGSVIVVGSGDMQPTDTQGNDIQPAEPPQEPTPAPEEQEQPTIVARLQQALGNVFEVVLR